MLVGYARVSTLDQNLDLQRDALVAAGCSLDRIYTDQASGKNTERLGLREAMAFLRPRDTLVVWKLDRLGRSLTDLIELVQGLQARDIGFRSLQEQIDTTTSGGKLVFHIFAALAEFERDIIRERTHAGLAAARARGKRGGRPTKMTERKCAAALDLLADPQGKSVREVCDTLGISRATFYRHRKEPTQ
jgi:DNA invertase Pin-like site-specific DNA recombinase